MLKKSSNWKNVIVKNAILNKNTIASYTIALYDEQI